MTTSYSNDINYLSSLELLVNGFDTSFPFIEKNIIKIEEVYIVDIDTNNLFSGDIINRFVVKAKDIEKIMITIDDVIVYLRNYDKEEEVNVTPFTKGIFTFCCKKSNITMYISSSGIPSVETMYNLVDISSKNKYKNIRIVGELEYKDGFAKVICPSVGR